MIRHWSLSARHPVARIARQRSDVVRLPSGLSSVPVDAPAAAAAALHRPEVAVATADRLLQRAGEEA